MNKTKVPILYDKNAYIAMQECLYCQAIWALLFATIIFAYFRMYFIQA